MASATSGFFQSFPPLGNQWHSDVFLQSLLKRAIPEAMQGKIFADLEKMGDSAVKEYKAMGDNADANEPKVQHFDLAGKRVDNLITAEGWRQLHDVSAREGLVAIAYEREFGQYSRLYQMAKLYLWSPDTAVYGCPLAMTDGAARLIELSSDDYLKQHAFPRLTSRDPKLFWTSGQWMTERPGGSDVGRTETEALLSASASSSTLPYRISGFKWFSSATDSDMTLLLARERDSSSGATVPGSRGLSLFFAPVRRPDGALNGVRIMRLKNKLGTKALPTAELELVDMEARRVGAAGRGVPTIATILNITRVYTAMSTVSGVRRALNVAVNYATEREAFGSVIAKQPLHLRLLADLEVRVRASTAFMFDVVAMLGRTECGKGKDDDEALLRLLTPIVKLFTAKEGIAIASEAVEAMGGQGYIEDTGVAKHLRNVQVSSIWEGTTNILALDVLRALGGDPSKFAVFVKRVDALLGETASFPSLFSSSSAVRSTTAALSKYVGATATLSRQETEVGAREFAFGIGRAYSGALLLSHAAHSLATHAQQAEQDVEVANRWCAQQMFTPVQEPAKASRNDARIVFPHAKL